MIDTTIKLHEHLKNLSKTVTPDLVTLDFTTITPRITGSILCYI